MPLSMTRQCVDLHPSFTIRPFGIVVRRGGGGHAMSALGAEGRQFKSDRPDQYLQWFAISVTRASAFSADALPREPA